MLVSKKGPLGDSDKLRLRLCLVTMTITSNIATPTSALRIPTSTRRCLFHSDPATPSDKLTPSSPCHPRRAPSPPRAGSYVLVSSSAPLDDSAAASDDARLDTRFRPKLFFLLPLVAALDVAVAITLGVLVLRQEAQHHDPPSHHPHHDPVMFSSSFVSSHVQLDEAAWERRKIVLLVVAFSITRALAYAMVGFSKRIRQLGVTIAAISILSTLFYVSIANLLFQARRKPDTLEAPLPFWSSLVSRTSGAGRTLFVTLSPPCRSSWAPRWHSQ